MLSDRIIEQINEQIGRVFAGQSDNNDTSSARNELQKSLRSVVQNAFSKLDLVTREEFDAQQEVLRKTRARVEQLEQELEELTKQIN